MFTSLTIENFRGLKHLTLNDLGRVNLIAGKNNTGKTSVLEALFLLSGSIRRTDLRFVIDMMRGIENAAERANTRDAWHGIFTDFDPTEPILISVLSDTGKISLNIAEIDEGINSTSGVASSTTLTDSFTNTNDFKKGIEYLFEDNGVSYRGRIKRVENKWQVEYGQLPSATLTSMYLGSHGRLLLEDQAEYFTRVQKRGLKQRLVDYLKIIEPSLTDIAILYEAGRPFIHGNTGKNNVQYRPIASMGDGINRLLDIILGIVFAATQNVDKGTILIDEIENGFHYSILDQVWKAIGEAARDLNVQVFATTHSYECIEAAHRAFSESPDYDFRYHRLSRLKSLEGEIGVVTYEKDVLDAALEMDLEVR